MGVIASKRGTYLEYIILQIDIDVVVVAYSLHTIFYRSQVLGQSNPGSLTFLVVA
jgi:hypothetical protein